MTKEQIYITTVKLNTEEAKARLDELVRKEKEVKAEYGKALSSGDDKAIQRTKKELSKVRKELNAFKLETMQVDEILNNLSSASINQLNKAAKSLNGQMRNLAADTQEFADKQKELKKVKARLAEIREESAATGNILTRSFDFLNKNWGAFTQILGSITGLSVAIRHTTGEYAEMEEAMANVQKYTGQTSEEVHRMNEEFKKIDTRTSREKLNALAGDAGRLGIQGAKNIMEFIDAADKIEVALGDDLGQDAVKNIGKLAETFGDSDKMGLRAAMLATGSAVNQLAGSSSAAAGYIVNFEARFAGLGNQAHMVQTDIMGLAAVLDQNMQQEETSSTALAQLMTKMYTEPQKFAQLAGKSIEDFTRLLKEDANEALLTFLESMRSKGGFDSLAPMFDEMGLSGVRCVGVLSTLATNLDEVRRQQKIASDAFSKGTSVLDEFNVQNNTVQAEVDKAKKKFKELSIELGEKLLPVVKYTISGSSLLIRSLSIIIKLLYDYKTYIIAVTAALTSYYAVMKAEAIWSTFAKGVKMSTNAIKGLWTVLANNPWGVLITLVSLATAALLEYRKKVRAAKEEAEELNRVELEALKTYSKEAAEIKALDKILHDETISIDKRREALDKLKQIIPGYNALLSEEGRLTRDNRDAIENYLISLEKQIKLKAYQDKLQELYAKQDELNETKNEQSKKYWDTRQTNTLQGYNRNGVIAKISRALGVEEESKLKQALDNTENALGEVDGKINSLMKKIATVSTQASEITSTSTNSGGGNGSSGTGSAGSGGSGSATSKEDPNKKAIEQSRSIAKQLNAINEAEYAQGIKLKADYEQRKYEITMEELERELAIYEKGTDDYKITLAEWQKTLSEQFRAATALQEEDIENEAKNIENTLKRAYNDPKSKIFNNQEALDQALFENTYNTLKKRRELYAESSQEYADISAEMAEKDEQNKLRLAEIYAKKVSEFKDEYLKMTEQERMEMELDFAKQLHDKGLLSEELYQKAIEAIKKKYASKDDANGMLKDYGSGIDGLASEVLKLGEAFAELSKRIKDGSVSWTDYAAVGESAMITILSGMQQMSSYYSASCELEVAQTEKKYDDMIKAAGKNSKKSKDLEDKKAKEVAKIKSKYNKKAMKIEIAQAIASTAMGAINAYSSAAEVPMIGYILAPIAAAAAVAAGALQIATIQKQHQAEAAGYYSGGYTGGTNYRREAGVVHEGEFVANHKAVNNPAISPVLNLIDFAQKRNTVGSLKQSDITGAIGGGGTVVAPIVNVTSDNQELNEAIHGMNEAVGNLVACLNEGIEAYSVIDGPNGSYNRTKQYERLISNK
ncbi:MAG: phage tail tape measure protein [Clostridiales bacterium]|nr:phage tail tape measure protein [Candidatus Crickella merdequi]